MRSLLLFGLIAVCVRALNVRAIGKAIAAQPDLSKLLETVIEVRKDLQRAVSSAHEVTIFAPNNAAFEKFKKSEHNSRTILNKDLLVPLLSYHVLNGTYRSADFKNSYQFLPTLVGEYPAFRNLSGDPQVIEVFLEDQKPIVKSGMRKPANVTKADIMFEGGVLHIIDSILAPPTNVSSTAREANLTSLVSALSEANLVDTVDTLSNVTIFAPTNEAFQRAGNVSSVLPSILAYHVIPNTVKYSSGLKDGQKLKAVNRGELVIGVKDGETIVNGAKVVFANVLTNNGVVHVIDQVLIPNNTSFPTISSPPPTGTGPVARETGAAPSTRGWGTAVVATAVMIVAYGMFV